MGVFKIETQCGHMINRFKRKIESLVWSWKTTSLLPERVFATMQKPFSSAIDTKAI